MRRLVSVLLLLAAAMAGVGSMSMSVGAWSASPSDGGATQVDGENGTAASPAPGTVLAAVISASQAEVRGELESRAFGHGLEEATTPRSKAGVVARQVDASETRLDELRAERARVVAAHENGSIDEGRYRAKLASIAASLQTVERLLDRSAVASDDLPHDVLERRGVDRDRIQSLRRNASELGGSDGASDARPFGGAIPGRGVGVIGGGADGSERGQPTDRPGSNRSTETTNGTHVSGEGTAADETQVARTLPDGSPGREAARGVNGKNESASRSDDAGGGHDSSGANEADAGRTLDDGNATTGGNDSDRRRGTGEVDGATNGNETADGTGTGSERGNGASDEAGSGGENGADGGTSDDETGASGGASRGT